MIVIRNTFVAKPGNASKLAALIKESTVGMPVKNVRVMTDLTGDFNRVVFEHEAANLTEFEAAFKEYMSNPAMRDKMKGYTDLYVTGTREIFQVA